MCFRNLQNRACRQPRIDKMVPSTWRKRCKKLRKRLKHVRRVLSRIVVQGSASRASPPLEAAESQAHRDKLRDLGFKSLQETKHHLIRDRVQIDEIGLSCKQQVLSLSSGLANAVPGPFRCLSLCFLSCESYCTASPGCTSIAPFPHSTILNHGSQG